jgi:glutamate 5-kinase
MDFQVDSDHYIQNSLVATRACVVKLGSQVIVDNDGRLSIDRLAAFVGQIAHHQAKGMRMVLVSSGAVALGRPKLGFKAHDALFPEQKQACAAVGQALMMNMYRDFFAHFGIEVAQVLVNPSDFSDRARYNRLKTLMETLLAMNVLPIVNENDAIPDVHDPQVDAQGNRLNSFDDNDKLAALVSVQMDADILMVLSNVEGVFTANPFTDPDAKRLTYIPELANLQQVETTGKTTFGRGGMASKLQAAELACLSGTSVVIASGLTHRAISSILDFQGTDETFPASFIQATASETTRFKRWIARASGYNGIVLVNQGAYDALVYKGASLLAVGVVGVKGKFRAGDVVAVQHENDHRQCARGIINYSSTELPLVMGLHTDKIRERFQRTGPDVDVIHRDRLVIESTPTQRL